MAYQTKDVIECVSEDALLPLKELRVDGGAAENQLLLQFQSDILDRPVLKPTIIETTALGAAYLAGLGVGYWRDLGDIEANWDLGKRYLPEMNPGERDRLYGNWKRAVERSKGWEM
jgi:glycerol kinase